MIRRTLAVIRKEILHILRDKRTLAIMLILPLVEMLLFGYAVTTDIKHLPLRCWIRIGRRRAATWWTPIGFRRSSTSTSARNE